MGSEMCIRDSLRGKQRSAYPWYVHRPRVSLPGHRMVLFSGGRQPIVSCTGCHYVWHSHNSAGRARDGHLQGPCVGAPLSAALRKGMPISTAHPILWKEARRVKAFIPGRHDVAMRGTKAVCLACGRSRAWLNRVSFATKLCSSAPQAPVPEDWWAALGVAPGYPGITPQGGTVVAPIRRPGVGPGGPGPTRKVRPKMGPPAAEAAQAPVAAPRTMQSCVQGFTHGYGSG